MAPSVEVLPIQDNSGRSSDENAGDVIVKPGIHDVLLGRGGGTNNHKGNVKFRKLVLEHKMRYFACSKVDKPKVAREVVAIWRSLTPPGRFLARKDESKRGPGSVHSRDNLWHEVDDQKAREKASQCLRERTPEVLPYIKQLREHQDAITEQGVSLVQQHLAMQRETEFPPSPTTPTSPAFPRRNSLSVSARSLPQPPISMAVPAPEGRPHSRGASVSQTHFPAPTRRAPGPPDHMLGGFHDPMYPESEFFPQESMTELDYQQNIRAMQRQLHLQQMQLRRLQEERFMSSSGRSSGSHHGPVQAFEDEEDMYYRQPAQPQARMMMSDPLLGAPMPRPAARVPKRTRDSATPEEAPSNPAAVATDEEELTLEKYRQQLEKYVANSGAQEIHVDDSNNGADSDLEDDWEKEREKINRGVDRNVSGMSFMSIKSGNSMFSGLTDLMSLEHQSRRGVNRNVSSNLSLMSDMTDLSQNIDNLSLYDD